MEVGREGSGLVAVEPVVVVEPRAEPFDILADRFLLGGQGEIHRVLP